MKTWKILLISYVPAVVGADLIGTAFHLSGIITGVVGFCLGIVSYFVCYELIEG